MRDGYREVETRFDGDGNLVLTVRGVEKGRTFVHSKSYSRVDDARAVHAELESKARGRPFNPDDPEDYKS